MGGLPGVGHGAALGVVSALNAVHGGPLAAAPANGASTSVSVVLSSSRHISAEKASFSSHPPLLLFLFVAVVCLSLIFTSSDRPYLFSYSY